MYRNSVTQRMRWHSGKKNLLQGIVCRDPSIPAFLHTKSLSGDRCHDILCLDMPGSILHGDQRLKGMELICRKADDRVIERQEMLAAEPGFFRVEFLDFMTIQHIENGECSCSATRFLRNSDRIIEKK